jgi:hypothetical protein
MAQGAAHVMAAPDPVACWGAVELYRDRFRLPITVFTGPATDNEVGRDFITGTLGYPSHNALRDAPGLVDVIEPAVRAWLATRGAA